MVYRESAREECDVCPSESTRTGKDGRPYCGMHGEPRAVIDEWQVERLSRIEALSRRLLASLYGDNWHAVLTDERSPYNRTARELARELGEAT